MICSVLQKYGLTKSARIANLQETVNYQQADKEKGEIHVNYLNRLADDENGRLALLESKTSQLVAQTGIIFSLLSLFVPLLIEKVTDFPVLIRVTLMLLLILAFLAYMLTIRNALKNFKVNKFQYSRPGAINVISYQDKSIADFHTEVVKDLIKGLKHNTKINNLKATNLIHSYNAFKAGNFITGLLVTLMCATILFFKPKEKPTKIEGVVTIKKNDSISTPRLKNVKFSINDPVKK